MEKNNGLIIAVIVVLSILVGLLGGYVLSDTLTDKNQGSGTNNSGTAENDNTDNNNNENDVQNNHKESFSIEEAKKLMNNYLYNSCGDTYLDNLSDEAVTRYLAMRRISDDGKISCSDIENTKFGKESNLNGCPYIKEFNYYSYKTVLDSAKVLFGPDFIINKDSSVGLSGWPWHYIEEYDKYVEISDIDGGGDCGFVSNTLEVYNFEIKNNLLYIYTNRVLVTDYDGDDENAKTTVTKNKYTFKKQDIGYYMTAVEEIK